MNPKVFCEVDAVAPEEIIGILASSGVALTVVNPHGPGGGNPVVRLEGSLRDVIAALENFWEMDPAEVYSVIQPAP